MRTINRIILHMAYTPPTMDIGSAEIRQWHLERGWRDIGYHYVIRRDGTIEAGRPVEQIGAHAAGYNHDSIGICLVGGKGSGPDCNFTRRQWAALDKLVSNLRASLKKDLEIIGHRDISTKFCPGFDAKAWDS